MEKLIIYTWFLLTILQIAVIYCERDLQRVNDEKVNNGGRLESLPVTNTASEQIVDDYTASEKAVNTASGQIVNIVTVDPEREIEITGSYDDVNNRTGVSSEDEMSPPLNDVAPPLGHAAPPPGHLKPLGAQGEQLVGKIAVLDYMIGGRDFYAEFMRKRQPVLFRGVTNDWLATRHWKNESYLLHKYSHVLFDIEMGKVYETDQHPRQTMTMREFLGKYKNTTKMYLDSPFPQSSMMGDMEVPLMMQCDALYSRFQSSHLLFSNGSTSSPLHYDGYENFLALMSGVKVAYLAHYKYAYDLYIDDYHDFPGLSPVNPERVDLVKYPRVSNVKWHKLTMQPGDILYIPEGWFHQVRSFESPNIAVSMWFHYFKEDENAEMTNSSLKLNGLARNIEEAPETIECKNQVINMSLLDETILRNIADKQRKVKKRGLVNNTVLYDLVSPSESMIYVGSDDHWIYAIEMVSGEVKWKVETKEDTGSTCAFRPDGLMIYCGADDNYMRAMHIETGLLEWAYKTGDRVISSAVVDQLGVIYFGSLDYNLYALFANGTLKWKKLLNGAVWATPAVDVENETIYITTENTKGGSNVFALRKQNGDCIWKKFSRHGFISSPRLSMQFNQLYLCDQGGHVYIFEPMTGSLVDKFHMDNTEGVWSTPVVHHTGILFAVTSAGTLFAYQINRKEVIWKLELGSGERGTNSSPYIAKNDILYVGGGNGTVFAIQPETGHVEWQTDIGTGIFFSSPRLASNGVLFIGSMDGPLYALESTTGKVVWTVSTNGPLVGTPLITREFT